MIIGAHALIYSRDAAADRKFMREVLKFRSVDAGGGWPIFALPATELAVHPAERGGRHELYLMCDDVKELVRSMGRRGISCGPLWEARWGIITEVTLPSGAKVHIYQPLHPSPFKRINAKLGSRTQGAGKRSSAKISGKQRRGSIASARGRKTPSHR